MGISLRKPLKARSRIGRALFGLLVIASLLPSTAGASSSWEIVDSPNRTSTTETNELRDVACPTSDECWAVGYYHDRDVFAYRPLIMRGNQGSWSLADAPNPPGNRYGVLNSIVCLEVDNCWAAGYYQDISGTNYKTLIMRYREGVWSQVPSPNSTFPTSELYGIACFEASDCWAVGRQGRVFDNIGGDPAEMHGLILHYDGIAWTISNAPSTGEGHESELAAVACDGSTCFTAGSWSDPDGGGGLLFLRFDGNGWVIDGTPSPPGFLNALTCAVGECWAVGFTGDFFGHRTLVMHRTESGWNEEESPNTDENYNHLNGVSCVAVDHCYAAGWSMGIWTPTYKQTMVMRYDGVSWNMIESPNTSPTANNALEDMTCESDDRCVAVGYYSYESADSTSYALVEEFLHGEGRIVPVPNSVNKMTNELYAVDCLEDGECWAVGWFFNAISTGGKFQPLIQRRSAGVWSIVPSPEPQDSTQSRLDDVACISNDDCWAVGWYLPGSVSQTLIEHWNGAAWTVVPSPNVSTTVQNTLNSVTCVTADDCWAVGSANSDPLGKVQTMIQHFDGESWNVTASPNPSIGGNNLLDGVACTASDNCWAVGYQNSLTTI